MDPLCGGEQPHPQPASIAAATITLRRCAIAAALRYRCG